MKRMGSESDFYHVVTVGAGHQLIFEEEADRRNLYRLMERISDEERIEIHAWCFMSNHVHLVVRCPLDALAKFMLRVERIYAEGFNGKYFRNGSLFRRPYWSDPILTEERLMATVRYVHRNPVVAKMANVRTCADYRWSSYNEYTRTTRRCLARTDVVMGAFANRKAFEAFHQKPDETGKFLDIDSGIRVRRTHDEMVAFAHELLGSESLSNISGLCKEDRDAHLRTLKEYGFTQKEIARLTGLGRGIISRA